MFEINIHKLWIIILQGMMNLPFVLYCNTESMCVNLHLLAMFDMKDKTNAYDSNILSLYNNNLSFNMHKSVASMKSSSCGTAAK